MERVQFHFELSREDEFEKGRIVEQLLKDKRILSWLSKYSLPLSFVENHAYKFKDYLERLTICDQCSGLSSCMQNAKGYLLTLEHSDVLEINACACRYLEEKNNALAHKQKFLICDMSDEQLKVSFDLIDLHNEKPSYLALVSDLIEACDKGKDGFFLCGEPGTGKTFLACCFLNEMAKKGKRVCFVNVSNFISTLKAKMYDKIAYQKQIDAIRLAEVVVFDDIGGESVSNWSRDEILLPVLNERMEKRLITLFTSNYDFDNLEKYYAINSKIINDKVGAKRLVERIKALSDEKVLNSMNRRLKKSRN